MNFEKLTNSFWKLQISGWLIYFVLMLLTFLSVDTTESFSQIFYIKTNRTIIGFTFTCILWQFYKRLFNRQSLEKIIVVVLISSAFFGVLWTTLEALFLTQILAEYDINKALPNLPRVALGYAVTITAWSAIYFGIKYWKQSQTERENALQANVLAEKAQLEMLRYQLNPHFLFNALNSIRASVDEDKQRAKQMITQLSEFLRHSLLSGESKQMALREELEAVKNYLAIEKIRFEEKLEVEFDIEEEAKNFKVPSFLLNPLVENAVKHGLRTSPKLLKINISAKLNNNKLYLEVSNTGKLETNSNSNGTKIGLKNVRERLNKLFPETSSLELNEKDGVVSARIEIQK